MTVFGRRTLQEIFSQSKPIDLNDPMLAWIDQPPPDFAQYILNRTVLPFDGIPSNPSVYKKDMTYAIAQMHRLWVTTKMIRKYLKNDSIVLDLGAFPFIQEVIIREYLHNNSRLIATMNLPLHDVWRTVLDALAIETLFLNLDKYVVADAEGTLLPDVIALDDASVDLVIFTHVIEHLYHPLPVFQEVARVLKPGGHVIVSTDNAMMLNTMLHLHGMNGYLHEPVEQMAAMSFHFWRGHNRFFTAPDLSGMLQAVGLQTIETAFHEVLYNAFSDEHFLHPEKSLPQWKAEILTKLPAHRNEIIVVARKA
jgi:SAM-dependent methyltransferase